MDLLHVGEVIIGNVFVAGTMWGKLTSSVKGLHERMTAADTHRSQMGESITHLSGRIDAILLQRKNES